MSGTAGSSCEGAGSHEHHPADATSSDWSEAEVANLNRALTLYPSDKYPGSLERCVLIAAQLPTRSAREVALRISSLAASVAQQEQAQLQQQPTSPGGRVDKRRSGAAAGVTRGAASHPASSVKSGLRSPRASKSKAQPARQQPNNAGSSNPAVAAAPPSSSPSAHQELQFPQGIPPAGPVKLLPNLTASCFYESSTPSSNSCEDASTLRPASGADTGAGTSGSAETSFGDMAPAAKAQQAGTNAAGAAGSNAAADTLAQVQSLIDQNYSILNTFRSNMQQCKVVENTELLVRYRDNMMTCLNHMDNMSSSVANMPRLPVEPNLELANKFLPPKLGMPMSGMPPMGMPPPFPFNPAMAPPGAMFPPGMFPPMPPGTAPPPGMMPPMPPPFPMPMMHPGVMPPNANPQTDGDTGPARSPTPPAGASAPGKLDK
mmetsp:Transcript_36109/g.106690  ORF Transcript_36109/g.106690 Transcript_36109/m.106690 type:complete len:432 (-) Transcript_36109:501-1796(-)